MFHLISAKQSVVFFLAKALPMILLLYMPCLLFHYFCFHSYGIILSIKVSVLSQFFSVFVYHISVSDVCVQHKPRNFYPKEHKPILPCSRIRWMYYDTGIDESVGGGHIFTIPCRLSIFFTGDGSSLAAPRDT